MSSMVSWYLNRLSAMSPGELFFRFSQMIQSQHEEYLSAGRKLPHIEFPGTNKILNVNIEKKVIFSQDIDIFGKVLNYSKDDINWHRDIYSGKSFPLIFSKKINIRSSPDLSAKNVWEINRLQFLTHISINYNQTGNPVYLNQFVQIMNSWIEENPYLIGINWYSNIEINIRLINWFLCWEILDVNKISESDELFGKFVREKWIPSIYQHCEYSFKNPSRFSSANNHLIAEYSGLFIAASKWKFSESGKWLDYAGKGLEEEILLQHSNGINREEAAEYIQFITDFFLLAYVVGEKTGIHFSEKYSQTLRMIFEYILEFIDIKGNYPAYGDSDDGKVLSLDTSGNFNNFGSLLTSALIIFKDSRFKIVTSSFDLKNEILFGSIGREIFDSITENTDKRNSAFFENEGHYIFRNQNSEKEIYLHFNAAPLGYLSMAAHGHADALSIILNINGYPVIVDPGTYCYHTEKKWRNYFAGTMAHSTVCIDGLNQAEHSGDTMWSDHYKCRQLSVKRNVTLESAAAEHNGYKKIKHLREVLFNKSHDTFAINDDITISDGRERECILLYHLHPDILVERVSPNSFSLLHQSGIRLSLSLEDFPVCSVVNGNENQLLGWYSDSFMQKRPTNVIYAKKTINQSFKSKTKIVIHEY